MRFLLYSIGLLCIASGQASAANVRLQATLINSCVLTLGTTGTMAVSSTGTQLGSEVSGGGAATLTVVAIGALPSLSFAAPSLTTSPSGWNASNTASIRYTSTGGASQAYTSSVSSVNVSGLTDIFSVHGKVDSPAGFAAGNYTLTTVVTCAQ